MSRSTLKDARLAGRSGSRSLLGPSDPRGIKPFRGNCLGDKTAANLNCLISRTQNSNGLVTAPSPSFGAFLKPFWAMPILLLFPLQMDSYFSPIRASWILRIVAVAFLRGRCRSRPRFTQHDAVQTLEGRTKYVPLSPKFQSQSGSVDVAYFTSYYSFHANSPI